MLCQVDQAIDRSDTNAPAPRPLNVNFREYDSGAAVAQAALAAEIALAITYNGLNQAVMMVSPRQPRGFHPRFQRQQRHRARPERNLRPAPQPL